jgi:hypothetical protein
MLRKILVVAVIMMTVSCLYGCKKSSNQEKPQPKTTATTESSADPNKEINKENMAQELDNLEKDIVQDTNEK